jgi:L-threonylcarbamoyladenylate synthase
VNALQARTPTLITSDDPTCVAQVAAALRSGMVAAIPTDTVYGLAAALDRPDALARLFRLKRRPSEKAIPVLLADEKALEAVATRVSRNAQALMERFWPGAITVVVPALPTLPDEVTSTAEDGTRTVAVRIPDHPVARGILSAAGGALAVTSANRSGEPPALDAGAVWRLGDAAPDIIVDAGPASLREASTVVLVVGCDIRILRAGAISASAIAEAMPHRTPGPGTEPHAV